MLAPAILRAPEYHGTVTLDGVDVSRRCAAVLVGGERPLAVRLYDLQDGRPFINRATGEIAARWHRGAITIDLRRRAREV